MFGEMNNRSSRRVEQLKEAFVRAGVNTEIPADIQVAMWMKFMFVTVLSGLGAVTRVPAGILRSLPQTRQMMQQALQEILAVARRREIALPEDAIQATMNRYDGLAPASTASMQRDVMEGRPSELEEQIGAVVRFAKESGVETPVHNFIYHSLLPMELRARGRLQYPE
jgi:2-dehydropantoate 2-reductase